MKKFLILISLLIFILVSLILTPKKYETNKKPLIAVSILPMKNFIENITNNYLDIMVITPPGYSPANYEVTPKQIEKIQKADIIYTIGVNSENSYINSIPKNKLVKLNILLSKKYNLRYFDDKSKNKKPDPHIWMSINRTKDIIKIMNDTLCSKYPKQKISFNNNYKLYMNKLDALNNAIFKKVNTSKTKNFLIFHPSLGYFADDYNLNMISIEENGKKSSLNDLRKIIKLAKKNNISNVLYQSEFDSNQAKVISKELGGKAIMISPLSKNYINSIKQIYSSILN